jgi:hypothetical protein
MENGVLELRPYDGLQRRRFVTDEAVEAGLGWNVIPPSTQLARRKGHARGCPFAVFNPARLRDLAWMLDWPGIVTAASALSSPQQRRAFLLTAHPSLPDAVIGHLSGYARSAIQKARAASPQDAGHRTKQTLRPAGVL